MVRQFSAGGVVYKKMEGKLLFLLCKSSSSSAFYSKNPWYLPKGWLDDAELGQPGPFTLGLKKATSTEVEQSALREVREEAGVEARIMQRLGNVQFFFINELHEKVFKTVIFFLMEYVSELSGGFGSETSEVKWVDLGQAHDLLKSRKGEYELLVKASTLI
jgi:8-oxo-dGTP diphosphatase